jgi:hypothetical protein
MKKVTATGIKINGDYRLAFVKPGEVTGNEIVDIDFTPSPRFMTPLPVLKRGEATRSLVDLHLASCAMMNHSEHQYHKCSNKGCYTNGSFDCRCPRWFAYLRKELRGK